MNIRTQPAKGVSAAARRRRMTGFGLALAAAMLLVGQTAWGASPIGPVENLYSPDDSRPCTFFRLEGVAEADPAVPGSPWFAVPKDHPAYWELFAMIAKARLSGRPLRAHTRGNVPCGYAAVIAVEF